MNYNSINMSKKKHLDNNIYITYINNNICYVYVIINSKKELEKSNNQLD